MTPCRDYGPTGHCTGGQHHRCAYSPGGACYGGIWLPECYLTLPPKGGRKSDAFQKGFTDGVAAVLRTDGTGPLMVIQPSHRYVCTCECHAAKPAENIPDFIPAGQLELFEVA